MDVLFPFGYGLSYTSFRYSNAKLIVNGQSVSSSATNNAEGSEPNVIPSITAKPQDQILVSVDITNTGDVYGKEVVQLYVKNAGMRCHPSGTGAAKLHQDRSGAGRNQNDHPGAG